jgi:hypothetical protein
MNLSHISRMATFLREVNKFERLLFDESFFEKERLRLDAQRSEAVWQEFFEHNPWLLGYGLFHIFTSNLDGKKLEQVVAGYSIGKGSGKRVDALLRTRGRVSSLCFAEIKTHRTPLLARRAYRTESWAVSREVAGAIAQAQRAVERAEQDIGRRLKLRDVDGNAIGDSIHVFRPRSIVVVGDLRQFVDGGKVNESQFSSFELFRRQLHTPEIITFDELYERARFIVQSGW